MPAPHRVVAWALAVPLCAATAWLAIAVVAERVSATAFGDGPPRNLAEAAATGRADDAYRRLTLGEDPTLVSDVRPDATWSTVLRVTPLEAAVWSRQLRMIQLFDREGAIRSLEQRLELACLALDRGAADMVEYLSPAAPPACVPRAMLTRVLVRTPTP